MHKKRFALPLLLLLLTLALAACATSEQATPTPAPVQETQEPGAIALGVGYIPSVQFAPLYVAIDKGYFADEGLVVSLEYGYETDYVKLVALGKRDFIIASGDVVILARSQKLPVTYVAEWYTKYPVVVFSPKENGIATPQDLVGKNVGIPNLSGTSYVGWKALVHATNLPEENIMLQTVGFNQLAALEQGRVDAAVDYAANGPVQLQVAGVPANVIVVDDYMHLPSNGLVTSEKVMAEHPERVEGMVRAMLRGIAYTLENPDEAFQISLQAVPEAMQNVKVSRAIFDASLPYWTPKSPDALGRTDPAIWPATAQFLADAGFTETPVPTDGIWTNDFVEKAGVTLAP